jgi:hypothetical protein
LIITLPESVIMACSCDIIGEARVECIAELGQVEVAVDTAGLVIGFGRADGAPAQRHGPVPPPLVLLTAVPLLRVF